MRKLLTGVCLAFALAGSAVAQQSGGQQSGGQQNGGQFMQLHDALNLSSFQEPAWQAYTTAMTPDPQTDARHRATDQMLPSLPTPRRLALIQAAMAQDAIELKRQGAAMLAFYSQLSPAQQRVFDAQTLPPSGNRNPPN